MSGKVIVVAGYGTGISHAVAEKFGGLGYKVALVSRTQSKLDEAAKAFLAKGITAKGFAVDLSKPTAVKELIATIRSQFGQIGILHWNAYGSGAGVLTATLDELHLNFDVSIASLILASQAVVEDLKSTNGSILVTGGGFGLENEGAVAAAVSFNAATLAIAKAAQRKTVHLLNASLKEFGVYAGEVTVLGLVKGTAWDSGNATITPESVADAFARLHEKRDKVVEHIG
ncbi:hypothetical protein HDU97_005002 [Phlyctochytrium planicorne]|nr:hypothetical protein HDU97_005002 [Phlyctochytrium planicorne]